MQVHTVRTDVLIYEIHAPVQTLKASSAAVKGHLHIYDLSHSKESRQQPFGTIPLGTSIYLKSNVLLDPLKMNFFGACMEWVYDSSEGPRTQSHLKSRSETRDNSWTSCLTTQTKRLAGRGESLSKCFSND